MCFNLVAFCAGRARHLFSSPFTQALCSTTSVHPPLLFSFPARLCPTPCPTALLNCFDIQIDSNTLSDQAAEKARIEITVMNPRRALEVSPCLPASPLTPPACSQAPTPPASPIFLIRGEGSPVGQAEPPEPPISSDVPCVLLAQEGGTAALLGGTHACPALNESTPFI